MTISISSYCGLATLILLMGCACVEKWPESPTREPFNIDSDPDYQRMLRLCVKECGEGGVLYFRHQEDEKVCICRECEDEDDYDN